MEKEYSWFIRFLAGRKVLWPYLLVYYFVIFIIAIAANSLIAWGMMALYNHAFDGDLQITFWRCVFVGFAMVLFASYGGISRRRRNRDL